METVPAAAQDNTTSSPSTVKGEDGNTPQGSGRASPPPNCAICLGTCRNKSFTDSCLHQFCFKCLLTWSKVKAVCPLCKQNFRSIIHNVRSNHQYEEYMVEQGQHEDLTERVDIDTLTTSRTFRYRTTLTLPRHDTLAFQQLLLQHYPMMARVLPQPPARRRRSPSLFRRTVYRHNLWARPLPDFTGRFRDCAPEFYRYNDTQMHRLMPWLNRELVYLLNENEGHITYVMSRILELLPQHHINSPEFREAMLRYFGDRTEHFLHELHCFASTPYDMTGYDRNVQYTTDSRVSTIVNEVISSSDSEASVDSDIVMISSSAPAEPPAGPSRVPAPVYPQNYIPDPSANNVIPIETISHSDTDDDSEVMVVGYIKPPQDRTPEIVDLLGSDSDVIVQDTPQPETSQNSESSESRPVNLVKLSLKWQNSGTGTDSDDSNYVPPSPRHRRRRRHRSGDTTTTTDDTTTTTDTSFSSTITPDSIRTTPSPAGFREYSSVSYDTNTYTPSTTPTLPAYSSTSFDGATSTETPDWSEERRKVSKRKSKRKSSAERSKKRTKRSTSRSHHKESKASQGNSDKLSKRKSHSGKGVKSSKKVNDSTSSSKSNTDQPQTNIGQPIASTSGISSNKKHNSDKTNKVRQPSHENRRLKSVVQVIKSKKNTNAMNPSGNRNVSCSVQSTSTRRPEAHVARTPPLPLPAANNTDSQTSDSEDNLPLNLTIKK